MESETRARKRKDFSRGRDQWSCPIEDEQTVQRSSMMQPSLNESRPRDDASFINPGHESERERNTSRELETLKGIFFAGCHRFTRRSSRFNQLKLFRRWIRFTVSGKLFQVRRFFTICFSACHSCRRLTRRCSWNSPRTQLWSGETWNGSWNGAFERWGFSESWFKPILFSAFEVSRFCDTLIQMGMVFERKESRLIFDNNRDFFFFTGIWMCFYGFRNGKLASLLRNIVNGIGTEESLMGSLILELI